MNDATGPRPVSPQDYYSAQQVMDLLRISKRRLYELAERDDDPLPLRTFPGAKRVTYEIVMAPGAESMEVQQRYLENQTYHHTPTVTGYFD